MESEIHLLFRHLATARLSEAFSVLCLSATVQRHLLMCNGHNRDSVWFKSSILCRPFSSCRPHSSHSFHPLSTVHIHNVDTPPLSSAFYILVFILCEFFSLPPLLLFTSRLVSLLRHLYLLLNLGLLRLPCLRLCVTFSPPLAAPVLSRLIVIKMSTLAVHITFR